MLEKKSLNKGVIPIIVPIGIICIILLAGLIGTAVNYTSVVSGKDSTIAAKNSQIDSLDSQIENLQEQVSELSSTPVLQPVQFSGSIQLASGTLANGMTYFYMVPNESRLVIEFASVRGNNLDPSDSIDLSIATWVNGVRVEHYLGVAAPQGRAKIDTYSQPDIFVSQVVRIYADPGTHVSVEANRLTRINTTLVVFSVSGYFLEVN